MHGIPDVHDPPERDQARAPAGVIDSHVHIFPPAVYDAIWRWFDENAWEIRYRLYADEIDRFLSARGVEAYLGLCYSHRPGMAAALNDFVLAFAAEHPRCIPAATVLPGEPGAEGILERALHEGARAVKIHSHVQCVSPDDPRLEPVYRLVQAHDVLLVIHCGNEPKTTGYRCDPHDLCSVARFETVMERHPEMKVCVPHLGYGEVPEYAALLPRYPNLYLDTAMAMADYFPFEGAAAVVAHHWDRILYGTDFPHLPFAWDRDLRGVEAALPDPVRRATVLGGNARRLLKMLSPEGS